MSNQLPRLPKLYESNAQLPDLLASPGKPNPVDFSFPSTLPLELALGDQSAQEICQSYDISFERFQELCELPAFQKAYEDAIIGLQKEGMSFKVKARLMSEELLQTAWDIIHNRYTQSNVKADLIKSLWRVAGFEPKANDVQAVTPIQINVNL